MADQEMGTKHDLCVGDSLYVAGEPQKMTERDYGELLSNSKVCGILYPSGNPVPVVSLVAQRGKKHLSNGCNLAPFTLQSANEHITNTYAHRRRDLPFTAAQGAALRRRDNEYAAQAWAEAREDRNSQEAGFVA
jgi:hypothetical protein